MALSIVSSGSAAEPHVRETRRRRSSSRRRRSRGGGRHGCDTGHDSVVSLVGPLLLLALAGWTLLVAEVHRVDGVIPLALLLAFLAAYLVSRAVTRLHGFAAPAVLVFACGLLAWFSNDTLLLGPHADPLGYSNATGALYLLAAGAAAIVAARATSLAPRVLAILTMVASATVPFLNGTDTAAILVLFVPLALLARHPGAVRRVVGLSALAAASATICVLVLGATYVPGQRDGAVARLVDATLSERRPMLWRDAINITLQNPALGVGPARFLDASPTVRANTDTPWPHNEILHFASEAGLLGAFLLLALFAWVAARMWWGGRDSGTAVAAATLGALAVQANVDYILHFLPVVLAAGVLAGTGSISPRPPSVSPDGPTRGLPGSGPTDRWDWSFLDPPAPPRRPRR